MGWNDFRPAPWMFFGSMMMFLFMIVCMVAMLFMMRMGAMHRSAAETGPAGAGFGSLRLQRQPDSRSPKGL